MVTDLKISTDVKRGPNGGYYAIIIAEGIRYRSEIEYLHRKDAFTVADEEADESEERGYTSFVPE